METMKLSKEAFDLAIEDLQRKAEGRKIRVEPIFDLLPSPRVTGETITHPTSLKTYIAEIGDNGLFWKVEAGRHLGVTE